MATFNATFSETNSFTATFAESNGLTAGFGEVQYIQVGDWYEGEYEATPSDTEQRILTAGKVLAQDFIINPIPSNYGLITQVGGGIRVS